MKLKSLAFLAVASGLLLASFPAGADCTLGHKSCRSGYLWVCERCGSETCWIFKGSKCAKDDDESPLPLKTARAAAPAPPAAPAGASADSPLASVERGRRPQR